MFSSTTVMLSMTSNVAFIVSVELLRASVVAYDVLACVLAMASVSLYVS